MDKIDKQILTSLQDDARVTIADLADRVSLTSSPCWRRVKALEEGGIIRGYHAELDPRRLGYDVTAFVSVMLENHRVDLGESFEKAVLGIPQVVSCHNVSGRYDFMLEVVATDLEAFGEFARNVLRTLPGVKEIYSSFSLKSIKHQRRLPLP
ncbi:MAG: Lrp/AsnC family transcriptional regulator [Proteobacteria bacterium]|nr:MAG: Lrp/AsnC family transcriptional regulator [Pseudomonadota bacterium]